MKRNSYDIEHEVEGFHWWFAVRRKLLATILSSFKFHPESLALDIGCGTVSNLRVLESAGFTAIGLDRSIYALSLNRKEFEFPLINGDLIELPIRCESVGLIVATDVLEHIEDDAKGIRELYRVLNNRGALILTIPAFNFLWGIQDEVTGHKRRYSKKEILDKLKRGGFEILKSSYFNSFLFIPILIGRRFMHIFGLKVESENRINFPMLNFFLKTIFSIEPHLLRYFSFPFGVSILCIAKKR
jgi:SAM-dependent methyltransferase